MRILCIYVALATGLLLFSCRKPTIEDDTNQPNSNLELIFTDTLTLWTTTVEDDSLNTSGLAVAPWGTMNDPIFGKTIASTYLQVSLPTNFDGLDGDNLVLDEAILSMRYTADTGYADINSTQSATVYEMTQVIDDSTTYYSNEIFNIGGVPIGQLPNFQPDYDSVQVFGVDRPAQLRIPMDNAFGQDLLDDLKDLAANDDDLFKTTILNGLYIQSETNSGGNGILYFDLGSIYTSLTLFYSSDTEDSLSVTLLVDSRSQSVSQYKFDRTGSVAKPYIKPDCKSEASDSIIFVQSMAGLIGRVKVPYLKNLGDDVFINKAELVLTSVNDPAYNISLYSRPGNMTANRIDDNCTNDFIDDQFISSAFFGGTKREFSENGETLAQYEFNLVRHFQNIIDGTQDDNGIFILTQPSTRIADRVVIGGGNHAEYAMKLNLTYTKVK